MNKNHSYKNLLRVNVWKHFCNTIFSLCALTTLVFSASFPHLTQAQSVEDIVGSVTGLVDSGVDGFDQCASAFAIDDVISSATGVFNEVRSIVATASNLLSSVPTQDPGSISALSGLLEATKSSAVNEQCLDALASIASGRAIESMNQQVIGFVNGFNDGQVKFVEDIDQLLADQAEISLRDFLATAPIVSQTCSVFRDEVLDEVRTAFATEYAGTAVVMDEGLTTSQLWEGVESNCALDQITGSPEDTAAFLNGDFSRGGWEGFMALVFDPGSNPSTASSLIASELDTTIFNDQQRLQTEIENNDGFLSGYECIPSGRTYFGVGECPFLPGQDPITGGGGQREQSRVITPGQLISDQLSQAVGSGRDIANLTDELSDLVRGTGSRIADAIFGTPGTAARGLAAVGRACRPGEQNCGEDNFTILGNPREFFGTYQGADPLGYLAELIADQVETEEEVIQELENFATVYNSTEVQTLINSANQCLLNPNLNKITAATLSSRLTEFSTIPDRVFNSEIIVTEEGPQKVDWAGNNFQWEPGRIYGLQECNRNIYRDDEGAEKRWRYRDSPQYSYGVSQASNGDWQWNIYACVAADDTVGGRGSDYMFRKVPHTPKAYRSPDNRRKIDWTGQPLDWSRSDRYENQFSYGLSICDNRTSNEYVYTVGNVDKAKQSIGENNSFNISQITRIVGGVLNGTFSGPGTQLISHSQITARYRYDLLWYEAEPGSGETWYRHQCRPVNFGGDDRWDSGVRATWPDELINSAPVGPARVPINKSANFDEYIAERRDLVNQLRNICASGNGNTLVERCDSAIQIGEGGNQSGFNQARTTYQSLSGSFVQPTQKRLILDTVRSGFGSDGTSGSYIDLRNAFTQSNCSILPAPPTGFPGPNPNNGPITDTDNEEGPSQPDNFPEDGPEIPIPDPRDEIRIR